MERCREAVTQTVKSTKLQAGDVIELKLPAETLAFALVRVRPIHGADGRVTEMQMTLAKHPSGEPLPIITFPPNRRWTIQRQ